MTNFDKQVLCFQFPVPAFQLIANVSYSFIASFITAAAAMPAPPLIRLCHFYTTFSSSLTLPPWLAAITDRQSMQACGKLNVSTRLVGLS